MSTIPTPSTTPGLIEAVAISTAGVVDRLRCRSTPDGEPTHWVHGLQARVQGWQTRHGAHAQARVAALDAEVAGLRALLGAASEGAAAPGPGAGSPAVTEAAVPVQGGRRGHLLAVQRRAARAARAREEAMRAERARAERRLGEAEVERQAALRQLDDLRELCREAFDARAARYTRARTGWLGLPRATHQHVPTYIPAPTSATAPLTTDTQPYETQED